MDGFLLFALFVASVAVSGWALTYGRSRVADEEFVFRMTQIRDQIEGDVFTGDLPDSNSVQFLWAKAGILVDHPEMISFSRLIAVLRCDVPSGTRITPSIGELSPKQRKRVHAYEKRIVETIAWYIEAGSRLWFLFPVIKRLPIERLHGRPPSRPEVVAVRFSKFMDQSSVQGPRGPMVSDRLVPH